MNLRVGDKVIVETIDLFTTYKEATIIQIAKNSDYPLNYPIKVEYRTIFGSTQRWVKSFDVYKISD